MTFRLGAKSESNLVGVAPPIVKVVRRAIQITTQDFGVFEGPRTLERQKALVAAGASRTLDSKHIPGADGFAHAVDLVPYVNGVLQWQMPLCIRVATAVQFAAEELKVELTWGAVWDRRLHQLDRYDLAGEIEEYAARYRLQHGSKRHPLIDGPHFQDVA